jgi:hypothetical protein
LAQLPAGSTLSDIADISVILLVKYEFSIETLSSIQFAKSYLTKLCFSNPKQLVQIFSRWAIILDVIEGSAHNMIANNRINILCRHAL